MIGLSIADRVIVGISGLTTSVTRLNTMNPSYMLINSL
jgi:hypothetical protein